MPKPQVSCGSVRSSIQSWTDRWNVVTDFNKYNPYPDRFTITCPLCAGPAEFRFAFRLLSETQIKRARAEMWPTSEITRWGGWHVVQHDPGLYRWKPPPQGYQRSDDGIRMCTRCVGRFRHKLEWPSDAYYRFGLKEGLLWAWTLPHARALADFIESKERAFTRGYSQFLRYIPAVFLDRRARARVVRVIRKRLSELPSVEDAPSRSAPIRSEVRPSNPPLQTDGRVGRSAPSRVRR
jgi:hypothetical protein